VTGGIDGINDITPSNQRDTSQDPEVDVLVVGGSQAGLAMGWHLADRGLSFVVLEAGAAVGDVWRSRWDSLTLFTPAQYDSLPGMPFPGQSDTYPTKDQVADYLQAYAASSQLPVKLNTRATALRRVGDRFEVTTADQVLRARQVVVATGPFQVPFVPPPARGLDSSVSQIHTSAYRNPASLPVGPVLVVGGGNSGLQIAEELVASRSVDVSIGASPPMLPQRLLGKDLFWWLTRFGLQAKPADSRLGRRMRARGEFVIGTSRRKLQRAGVRFRPRLAEAEGRTVRFADGTALEVDVVIWATGFRSDYSWINVPGVVTEGRVVHQRGVTDVPGLYFLGLSWQHTRGSALLGFVMDDAGYLAEQIAARGRVAADIETAGVKPRSG
jgi:putative flavoprotein involved in K+ transport